MQNYGDNVLSWLVHYNNWSNTNCCIFLIYSLSYVKRIYFRSWKTKYTVLHRSLKSKGKGALEGRLRCIWTPLQWSSMTNAPIPLSPVSHLPLFLYWTQIWICFNTEFCCFLCPSSSQKRHPHWKLARPGHAIQFGTLSHGSSKKDDFRFSSSISSGNVTSASIPRRVCVTRRSIRRRSLPRCLPSRFRFSCNADILTIQRVSPNHS